jgi:hypothetical protein
LPSVHRPSRAPSRLASNALFIFPVSVGEPLREGIGRPAPVRTEAGPPCLQLSVSVGAAPSLQAPGNASTLAPRLVATVDTGSGAGGRASTVRTAPDLCPRPTVDPSSHRRRGHRNPPPVRIRHASSRIPARAIYQIDKLLIRLTFYAKRRQKATKGVTYWTSFPARLSLARTAWVSAIDSRFVLLSVNGGRPASDRTTREWV